MASVAVLKVACRCRPRGRGHGQGQGRRDNNHLDYRKLVYFFLNIFFLIFIYFIYQLEMNESLDAWHQRGARQPGRPEDQRLSG